MSTKSKIACSFNIDSLAEGARHVYLWTFTFPLVQDVRVSAKCWTNLQHDLVRRLGFHGVRVFERHPKGHGLHVHVLVRDRYDVNAVRRYSTRHGFGRIHVKPIPAGAASYVAKYLNKQSRLADSGAWKGVRLWAVVGKRFCSFDVSHVKDIEFRSACHDLFRRVFSTGERTFRRSRLCLHLCQLVSAGFGEFRYQGGHYWFFPLIDDIPDLEMHRGQMV